jgi:hypothetical protein
VAVSMSYHLAVFVKFSFVMSICCLATFALDMGMDFIEYHEAAVPVAPVVGATEDYVMIT